MMLSKANHALVEWYLRASSILVHHLVLGCHDHLVLLLEDLLLQLLLTTYVVGLRILPQVSLINDYLHLPILIYL